VDVNKLKLSHATDQDGVKLAWGVDPCHEFRHQRWHVSIEDECPLTHGTHPLLGKRGCLQEPPSAFNLRQRIRDGVGDRETWLKTLPMHEANLTRLNRKAARHRDSLQFTSKRLAGDDTVARVQWGAGPIT
jgi:hypothetical protein